MEKLRKWNEGREMKGMRVNTWIEEGHEVSGEQGLGRGFKKPSL